MMDYNYMMGGGGGSMMFFFLDYLHPCRSITDSWYSRFVEIYK